MARSATDEKVDRSIIENRAPSVGHMFRERVQALPQGEAFRHPVGDGWESLTWSQTRDRAYALAAGLVELGVQPEERVAPHRAEVLQHLRGDRVNPRRLPCLEVAEHRL